MTDPRLFLAFGAGIPGVRVHRSSRWRCGPRCSALTLLLLIFSGHVESAFQQEIGGDFIVSIEAESFSASTPRRGHQWVADLNPPAGQSGVGLVVTQPDNGTARNGDNYVTVSPRLDYPVNFVTTGPHYLHVRGYWRKPADDTVHLGLNGKFAKSAKGVQLATRNVGYVWNSVRRSFNVPSAGIHTVNLWMMEDGTPIDKIVITTNPNYAPTGSGPVESSVVGANRAPTARADHFNVSQGQANNVLSVLRDNGSGADSDPDGDSIWITSLGPPSAGGAVDINSDGTAVLYTPAIAYVGTETFTYTIRDEHGSQASATVTVAVSPPSASGGEGSPGFFQQSSAAGFIVSMEAERFESKMAHGSHQWVINLTAPVGQSGMGLVETTPNVGFASGDAGYVGNSPRLDYKVNFVRTGTHYIFVRGYWRNYSDDSVHAGLNGEYLKSASRLYVTEGTVGYRWNTIKRSFNVPATGLHTVNLWMREDGTPIDKIVITADPNYVPSGAGPEESVWQSSCDAVPSVKLLSPKSGHIQSTNHLQIETLTCLDPIAHAGWGVKFELNGGVGNGGSEDVRFSSPYTANFLNLARAEHRVAVRLVNDAGDPVVGANAEDVADPVGVGDYYVAIGDSITLGTGDDQTSDDVSADARITARGFPPILSDLLTEAKGFPHAVFNEGVGGITSAGGLERLPNIINAHPHARTFLVKYGMNDARPWLPVPSGLGLSIGDAGYPGTFKDNIQRIVNMLKASGKSVALAKINIALADGTNSKRYPNPMTGARTLLILEYNQVIEELVAEANNGITIAPPDYFDYFAANYETEYADPIHPNGVGYGSMANLWFQVLTQ